MSTLDSALGSLFFLKPHSFICALLKLEKKYICAYLCLKFTFYTDGSIFIIYTAGR